MIRFASLSVTTLLALALTLPSLVPVQATPSPPSAPQGLVVAAGPGPGETTLRWTPPATDGGSPVTGYKVFRGQVSGQLAQDDLLGPVLTYVDRCVGHGQTWYYQVSAINSAGEGPRSSQASGASGIPPSVGDSVVLLGARLPSARYGTSAAWAGNVAYVFGGNVGSQDSVIRYDPVSDCAVDTDALLPTSLVHSSALWDGQAAYIFGGNNFQLGLSSDDIIKYDPSLNTATLLLQSLPSAREGTSALVAGTQQIVVGGHVEDLFSSDEVDDVFDAKTGQVVAHLPEKRAHTAAVWTGSRGLVFGGKENGLEWEQIYSYDPVTRQVVEQASILPHGGIQGAGAAWDGTRAYIAGGWSFDADLLNEIQAYNPATDGSPAVVPTLSQRLPYAVAFASSAWDGRHMYLFGGENAIQDFDSIVRYTPALATERDAPQNLQASRGPNPGQISLSWQAPTNAAGLTGYRIYRGLTPATVIRQADTSNVLTFVDGGLAEGALWCYKITALFGATEGRISNDVCAKAPERPAAPLPPIGVPGANLGDINLSWQPPLDNGGLPVTSYKVYRNGAFVNTTSSPAYVDQGLAAWTLFTYKISAVNAVGEGAQSLAGSSYAASAPSMPRSVQAFAAGPGKLTVTWQVPVTNGGKPITGYNLYRTEPDGTERWLRDLPPVLSFADSYLDKATYGYRITAVNVFGEGQSSPVLQAPAKVLPARPDVASSVGTSPGSVHLSWVQDDDGGSALLRFYVYRGTQAGNVGTLIATLNAAARAYDDLPGAPALNYYYRVEAETGIGKAMSHENRFFLPPPPPPGGGGVDLCGILDTADLDGDGTPDCRDEDIDGDHLSNEVESKQHLNFDPRDRDIDDDGLPDQKDPVPTAKGFGAGIQVEKICHIPNADGNVGWAARGDPWLDSSATLRLGTDVQPAERLLSFYKLRLDNHFHNNECVDFTKLPVWNSLDTLPLPDITKPDWEWINNLGLPNLQIDFPLHDHDANNCDVNDQHNCWENAGEDNPMMGMPDAMTVWSLLTMRLPGKVGIDPVAFDNGRALTVAKEIWLAPNKDLDVFLKVNVNASGCDLLTHVLGRTMSATDPHGPILQLADFANLDANPQVNDSCAGV